MNMSAEFKNIGFIVAESEDKARELALKKFPQLKDGNYRLIRDEDCLDTWFSSWLWPISVFDGINDPDNEDIKYYYPTSDLVTGPDIIFFWVARMIMAGYEYRGEECFRNVYFTGIVRDKLGRKMSKQLGNSPDPIELIDKYGADGVRMGMLLSAPAGNDIHFDEALCEQGRNFCNKIWNAFRLIRGFNVSDNLKPAGEEALVVGWFEEVLRKTVAEVDDLFSKYRISEALMTVYKLFWDDFCAWYLEMIKPEFGKPVSRFIFFCTAGYFNALLKLLHPFMPFITEELWQELKRMRVSETGLLLRDAGVRIPDFAYELEDEAAGETIMLARMPDCGKNKSAGNEVESGGRAGEQIILYDEFNLAKEIIANIRTIRRQKNIPLKKKLQLQVSGGHHHLFDRIIEKLADVTIETVTGKSAGAVSFMVGTFEYSVPVEINREEEIARIQAEIRYLEGFLCSVKTKLDNEKFIANARPEVVENERKKCADAEEKIRMLEESIRTLT
jgi:valyl-tRNA synthetase